MLCTRVEDDKYLLTTPDWMDSGAAGCQSGFVFRNWLWRQIQGEREWGGGMTFYGERRKGWNAIDPSGGASECPIAGVTLHLFLQAKAIQGEQDGAMCI